MEIGKLPIILSPARLRAKAWTGVDEELRISVVTALK